MKKDLSENEMIAMLNALPSEIVPQRDLRPGIAERIATQPQAGTPKHTFTRSPLRTFAAAAVLVIVTASITYFLTARQNVNTAFTRQEGRYVNEIAALQNEIARNQEKLSPETLQILQRNMAVIDQALTESRAALNTDPKNDELGHMVLSVYQKKVELLRSARTVGL